MIVIAAFFLAIVRLSWEISCAVVGEKECSKFDYEYRVLERIIFLENKNQEMERKQAVLERKNEELVEIIKEQRLEMERRAEELETSLANTINQTVQERYVTLQSKLEQVNDGQTIARQKLRNDIEEKDKLQNDIRLEMKQDLEAKDRSQDEDIQRLEKSLTTKIAGISTGMSDNRSNVYFTARLNSNRKYKNGETIVFGTIVGSEGGAYDAGTGIFTSPRKGVYLFSVTAMVYNNGVVLVYIKKNSDSVGHMHADGRRSGSGDSNYETASVTVVVELAEGDKVYAQFGYATGSLHYTYTAFTGVLLN